LVGNGRSGDDELAADASVQPAAAVAGGADRSTSIGNESGVITPADPNRTEAAGAGPADPTGTSAGVESDSTVVGSRVDWPSAPNVRISLPGEKPRTAPDRGSTIRESDGSPTGSPSESGSSGSQRPSPIGSPATSPPTQASGATTVPATPVVNSGSVPTSAVASTIPPTVASTTRPTVASTTTTAQARFVFDDVITIEGDDDDGQVKIQVLKNDDPGGSSFNIQTLRIVTPPRHAKSYRVHKDHIRYKSIGKFTGTDRIVYEVCTNDLRCGQATVSITVTSDD
jgi:hypothetical protein